ncbi:MAG: DUF1772 domain-containing protein [Ilumatobacteraceae bacterium]
MITRDVLLFGGILSSGLMAGLWFGWVVSVIPGLAKVGDRTYISTMQSINVAIVNPLFIVVFLGTVFVLAAAAIAHFVAGDVRRAWWLTAAGVTYLVGVLGVTVGANVPLNDRLAAFDLDEAADDAVAAQRLDYESPWNRRHGVRTVANLFAVSFAVLAALTTADPD